MTANRHTDDHLAPLLAGIPLQRRAENIHLVLETIVRRLVTGYAPQRIILFGSYAYGYPHQDSDIDLLIIKDTTERLPQRLTTVRRVANGAAGHIPFEPLVLTPAEVAQRLEAGDQFIARIIHHGQLLYAA